MLLNTLQFKLTAGSILKLLTLVAVVSGISYVLVGYYLAYKRDLALREQMGLEFNALGLSLPAELSLPKDTVNTAQDWQIVQQIEESIELYDDDDVASFVTPFDAQARPISNLPGYLPGHLGARTDADLLDQAAVQAARRNGSDLRTIFTKNDLQVRLLTYRLPPTAPVAYLQVGRLLADEDRIKHRFLLVLSAGGVLFTVAAGGLSWFFTGRSLRATWQAWERQQTFVANASHELRTPLTLIRASAQFVQQSLPTDNPQRLLMDDVLGEADHMAKLVDDLLMLSRLDASEIQLDPQVLALSDLLPRIQRQFMVLANERNISIRVTATEGQVKADPTRLWQVLLILVDNALHHTPPRGTVTLSSRIQDDVDERHKAVTKRVKISVTDTGNGIASEDLPHVFERFYKAHNNLADRRSAGLGLSIAKPLIELHGGEIDIDSQIDAGTRVTITLPAHGVAPVLERTPLLKPL
jgi:signal transduction histidine kinase